MGAICKSTQTVSSKVIGKLAVPSCTLARQKLKNIVTFFFLMRCLVILPGIH